MANPNPNCENLSAPRYKKGTSGNPNGRPKNRALRDIADDAADVTQELYPDVSEKQRKRLARARAADCAELTKEEINTWRGHLIAADSLMVKRILKNASKRPMFAVGNASGLLNELKVGRTATITRLVEEQYGKVTENIALVDARTRFDEMTVEQLVAEAERFYRAIKGDYGDGGCKGNDERNENND